MQIATTISFIGLAISSIAFYFSIKSHRETTGVTLFLAFTDRYEKLLSELRPILEKDNPILSEPDSLILIQYLNLCSVEYFSRKKLPKGVWEIWEEEICENLQKPIFRHYKLSDSQKHYNEFFAWVNEKLK
ncbi:MAG: hypothetical protein Q8916_03740 [Bacteroidota bacterium]|nr:hypothetical protein [Bacteroidota bacterium]